MFVFNMQFLWKYIDDIVGKDLEIWVIFELLFYQALAMVPKSLVFGMVIASVMTMGNLAEHYELVSMKAVGISLARIMQPLVVVSLLLGGFSFAFSNNFIPVASLRFKARLHDIRKQKPALNLEAGKFNNDFRNVVIYIGSKDKTGYQLRDVKIYDHTGGTGLSNQINAEKGSLFYTEDKRFLVLLLENGERQEDLPASGHQVHTHPYTRMRFERYTLMFNLAEFDLSETDESLFAKHHSLLSVRQLRQALDSLYGQQERLSEDLQRSTNSFYHYRRAMQIDSNLLTDPKKAYFWLEERADKKLDFKPQDGVFAQHLPQEKLDYLYQRAANTLRVVSDQAQNIQRSRKRFVESVVEHENEIHQKFLYAISCLLFFLIGAPMGAIIRKGGFGYPILVAFSFFMVFFVLNLSGEQLAKSQAVPTWLGAWLPALVLFPIAIYLMQRAKNDQNLFDFSSWRLRFPIWFKKPKT